MRSGSRPRRKRGQEYSPARTRVAERYREIGSVREAPSLYGGEGVTPRVPVEIAGLRPGTLYRSAVIAWTGYIDVRNNGDSGGFVASYSVQNQEIIIDLDESLNDHYDDLPEGAD